MSSDTNHGRLLSGLVKKKKRRVTIDKKKRQIFDKFVIFLDNLRY